MGKFETKMYEPECVASSLIAGINSNKERLFTIIIDEHFLQKILKQRLPEHMEPKRVVTQEEIRIAWLKHRGVNEYGVDLVGYEEFLKILKELGVEGEEE